MFVHLVALFLLLEAPRLASGSGPWVRTHCGGTIVGRLNQPVFNRSSGQQVSAFYGIPFGKADRFEPSTLAPCITETFNATSKEATTFFFFFFSFFSSSSPPL
jgi:hypothetical protein